jgi:hypothetical protein
VPPLLLLLVDHLSDLTLQLHKRGQWQTVLGSVLVAKGYEGLEVLSLNTCQI